MGQRRGGRRRCVGGGLDVSLSERMGEGGEQRIASSMWVKSSAPGTSQRGWERKYEETSEKIREAKREGINIT